MSEFKVGDRVKIVIEDFICGVDEDDGEIDLDEGGSYLMGSGNVVSIEVIPAPFVLPTKRWAQVVDGEGFLWTRHTNGDWWTSTGHWDSGERLITQRGPLRIISEGVDDE
jgi:hypothetical protein